MCLTYVCRKNKFVVYRQRNLTFSGCTNETGRANHINFTKDEKQESNLQVVHINVVKEIR